MLLCNYASDASGRAMLYRPLRAMTIISSFMYEWRRTHCTADTVIVASFASLVIDVAMAVCYCCCWSSYCVK